MNQVASLHHARHVGLGLLVVSCLGAVAVLSFRLDQCRRDHAQLRTQCLELRRQLDELHVENSRLVQAGSRSSVSDAEKLELLRLRNQAAQLKAATNELQRLRGETGQLSAENQRLRAGPARPEPDGAAPDTPAALVPKANWTFAGYATPEATFQSMAWAMNQGDLQSFLASLMPDERAGMLRNWGNKSVEEIAGEKRGQMNDVTGFRILDRRQIRDDLIALTIYAEGKGDSAAMLFQRVGTEWKFAGKHRPPGASNE